MALTSAPPQLHSDRAMRPPWSRMQVPDRCQLVAACRSALPPADTTYTAVPPEGAEAPLPPAPAKLLTSLSCDSSLAKYVSEVLRGLSDAEAAPRGCEQVDGSGGPSGAQEPPLATSASGLPSPQGKRSSGGSLGAACQDGTRKKTSRTAEGQPFPGSGHLAPRDGPGGRDNVGRSGPAGSGLARSSSTGQSVAGGERFLEGERLLMGGDGGRLMVGFSPKPSPFFSLFPAPEHEHVWRAAAAEVGGGGEVAHKAARHPSVAARRPPPASELDFGTSSATNAILRRAARGAGGSGSFLDSGKERSRPQRLQEAPAREDGGGGGGLHRVDRCTERLGTRPGFSHAAAEEPVARPLAVVALPLMEGVGAGARGPLAAVVAAVVEEEKAWPRSNALPPEEPIKCKVAAMTCAGQRDGRKKPNQDAYCFMRSNCSRCLLFGVFDGHGPNGQDVAGFCKKRLPEELMKLPGLVPDPLSAFPAAFGAVNECLGESDASVSGTTAVMAQLHERRLTVAWVGDSRCVLASVDAAGSFRAEQLTSDHKPDCAGERCRIEENNGRVDRSKNAGGEEVGPFRVWLGIAPILGLAMSRSLGDALAHSVGVISTPDTVTRELSPEDRFMILATDGVWEWLTCEQAVRIVSSCPTMEVGCKKLVHAARQKWRAIGNGYVDDITAVVVEFTHQE